MAVKKKAQMGAKLNSSKESSPSKKPGTTGYRVPITDSAYQKMPDKRTLKGDPKSALQKMPYKPKVDNPKYGFQLLKKGGKIKKKK